MIPTRKDSKKGTIGALNCKKGIDNISEESSCENCHCKEIANSKHIDVLEMDAASKTGVDDVRDLIEYNKNDCLMTWLIALKIGNSKW